MHSTKLTAVASLLLMGVLATPIENKIVKRSEGVHLVNCNEVYSAVVYCSNDSNCNFFPGSGNECIPGSGIETWEGKSSCTFSTGVTFSWAIVSNAQNYSDYSEVGSGSNGKAFNIFKDDKHTMYYDGNGYACKSIYYALDA